MGRKAKQEQAGGGGIMVMYVSLMILLLAFFILLNSMSKTSEQKVGAVYQSLVGSFGFAATGISPLGSGITDTGGGVSAAINPVEQDYGFLRGLVAESRLQSQVSLLRSGSLRSVNISNLLLFEPDSFELTDEGKAFLSQVADLIKGRGYPISIYGHTDDAAGAVAGLDDFDISARRALAVLRFFTERGVAPGRLAAFGLGDTRPMVPNNTAANRRSNNRIELVFDARDASRHRLPARPGQPHIDFRGFTFELPRSGTER